MRLVRLSLAMVLVVAACAAPVQASIGGGPRKPRDLDSSSCNVVKIQARGHVLYRRGVSCSFAKRWADRMAATRGRSKPAGWSCTSGDGFRLGGYCERGQSDFGWQPIS
jgi:hypothetical protein